MAQASSLQDQRSDEVCSITRRIATASGGMIGSTGLERSTMRTFSAIDMAELLNSDEAITKANEWLARGEGIAVYRNESFDSIKAGHRRFFPFGTADAQFMVPPQTLPDFPGEINWRYQLEGTYRGSLLEPPGAHDWATPAVVLGLIADSFTSPVKGRPDRLVGMRLDVEGYTEAAVVTFTLQVTETAGVSPREGVPVTVPGGRALTPLLADHTVRVMAVTNERGEIDRLGTFWWTVTGPVPMQDETETLGSTIVNVHNRSMKEG